MTNISRFFNSFDKVMCVSLEASLERRKHILSLVATHKIKNLEFLGAVTRNDTVVKEYYANGRVKKFPDCFRCGQFECGRDDCNNTLIASQVATFLSYIKLWTEIRKKQITVLIIEDDVVLSTFAEDVCEDILKKNFLSNSGLYSNRPMLLRFGWALCDEHHQYHPFSISTKVRMANPAHAINGAMAGLLLDGFENIDTTVDVYQHRVCTTADNSITCHPPLFYEMSWSTGEVESCIHPKKIRLEYLKKQNRTSTTEYSETVLAIANCRKHTLFRKLLVSGHPRCGTGYTAALLSSCGLQVGHELMLADGIASWMFAVYDQKNPYALDKPSTTRYFTYFKYHIHPVREPRKAVASIITENRHADQSLCFRKKHILKERSIDIQAYTSEVERAVASLVYWTLIIEMQKPDLVFRIEDQSDLLVDFLESKELLQIESSNVVLPAKNINSGKPYKGIVYKNPELTAKDFEGIDAKLLCKLNVYCEKYGYPGFAN